MKPSIINNTFGTYAKYLENCIQTDDTISFLWTHKTKWGFDVQVQKDHLQSFIQAKYTPDCLLNYFLTDDFTNVQV